MNLCDLESVTGTTSSVQSSTQLSACEACSQSRGGLLPWYVLEFTRFLRGPDSASDSTDAQMRNWPAPRAGGTLPARRRFGMDNRV